MTNMDLVNRLAAHKTLSGAPRAELEWLAQHGELRRYAVGEVVSSKSRPTVEMLVVLTGDVIQYVARGTSAGGGSGGGGAARCKLHGVACR